VRSAPSLALIVGLQDLGAKIRVHDPKGIEQAKSVLIDVTYCDDAYSCSEGADALVIVTEWEPFRTLDFERLRLLMAKPILVDLRNIYRPNDVARYGFAYHSVGRPAGLESGQIETHAESDMSRHELASNAA
jgi:UDPglucose 6-dehydrogenase